MTAERKIWLVSLAFFAAYSGLVLFVYPAFSPDVVTRYAPMADELARGNWMLGFHPRFGVLFSTLTGLVAACGIRGDHACQIVSILFLSLSAVPIWHLARKLFGETVAWWTVALVLLCDDFARYAADGLRDTGKCLAFALLGWGAVSGRARWFALGLFVLATLVSYGYAVAVVLLFGWCLLRAFCRPFSWGGFAAPIGAFAVATALQIMMVHAYTGHWVPQPHFIRLLGGWL